jgi:hypothetical protein
VDDTFSLVKIDEQLTIRPASAFKASRSALPDHELPFSIFLCAKNLFLTQANTAKWPQTHIDALALFFWHLENHSIWNNSELSNLVVLHYASQVRLDWHNRLKRDEGFNIGIINENLLWSINEEIWDRVRSRTLIVVCIALSTVQRSIAHEMSLHLYFLQTPMILHINLSLPAHQRADAHYPFTWMPALHLTRMPTLHLTQIPA